MYKYALYFTIDKYIHIFPSMVDSQKTMLSNDFFLIFKNIYITSQYDMQHLISI